MKRIIILFYLLSGLHLTAQTQTITNPIYDKQSAPKEYKITKIIKSPTSIEFYITYNPVKPYTYENRILESNMYDPKLTDFYTGKTYYGKKKHINIYEHKLIFKIDNAKDVIKVNLQTKHVIYKIVSSDDRQRMAEKILLEIKRKTQEMQGLTDKIKYIERKQQWGKHWSDAADRRRIRYVQERTRLHAERVKLYNKKSKLYRKDRETIEHKIIIKNIYVDLNPNLKVEYDKTITSIYKRNNPNSKDKVRRKVINYFKKKKLEKAENLLQKRKYNNNHTKTVIADNYFVKGMNSLDNVNYTNAIYSFIKAKSYYKKAGKTDDELKFIDRKLGICKVNLAFEDDMTYENQILMLNKAYNLFNDTNSYDLLKKYDDYFSGLYLDKYKRTSEDKYLDKAYKACYDSKLISKIKKPCGLVADELLKKHNDRKNNKDLLEESINLYKKLNDVSKLDLCYENMAIYYIYLTKTPKKALEYIDKISNISDESKNKYYRLIDFKLVDNCKSFDDCIKVGEENPKLKDKSSDKAISIINNVDECIVAIEKYPDKKSEIEKKLLEVINTTDEGKKALAQFPDLKGAIGNKMLEVANSIEALGYINNNFPNLSTQAEQKAINNVKTLDNKREFVKYFENSSYSQSFQKDISIAEENTKQAESAKKDFEFELNEEVAPEVGKLVMKSFSSKMDGGNVLTYPGELEIKNNHAYIPIKVEWSAYYLHKPLEYKTDLNFIINLENDKVTWRNPRVFMNGQEVNNRRLASNLHKIFKLVGTLSRYIKKMQE